MTVDQIENWMRSNPIGETFEVQQVLNPQPFDEKSYDRDRKAKQRASGRELFIPIPKNIPLRLACLQDPELLLTTYFPSTYFEPFTEDRRDMLRSIWRAAQYGGDQAIAGSRGEGKTTLAMDGAFCLMISGLSFFPVIIGKNQDASSDELKALRERIMVSERFVEDFPEIGVPLQAVGPQTANARLQTVAGKFVGMFLGAKHFALPKIEIEQLPHWPKDLEPVSKGQVIGAVGIEGRIRGFKFRSHRPTVALIDDVEDKDSVRSDDQIAKIETTIEEDVGGMGSSAERIARVYLCTTLNRKCNAYKYTDRKQKPSWNGRRYRKMIKPPDRMDLVEQYIEMRKSRDGDTDPDARIAFAFWRDNKDEIERGAIVSNKHSYSKKIHADGQPLELSAIHSYYNRVADVGQKAVSTEIDNDPPETVGPQGIGLTASIVRSRLTGLLRGEYPDGCDHVTIGLDIGKYDSHWVKIAWKGNAIGSIIDYGTMVNRGMSSTTDSKVVMSSLVPNLMNWRNDMMADGRLDFCLVDSGDYTEAIYEFIRKACGVPFAAAKGWDDGRFSRAKESDTRKNFHEVYASYLTAEKLWLYNVNTEFWKFWTHQRFVTPTYDENEMANDGTLSLFSAPGNRKIHHEYSNQILAEEMQEEFVVGKGLVTKWVEMSVNNHHLDATALACAAAGCLGVRLVRREPIVQQPAPAPQPRRPAIVNPYGQPFLATERK
jgi:hypothetical protein